MGTEKAFLKLQGRMLIDHMIALGKEIADQVRIVGPKQKFSGFGRIVTDVHADKGPLGGIHAALAATNTDFNVMLAVDTPFLELKFLKYLTAQARATQALVTVPRTAAGYQPLCASYRREFLPQVEEALARGSNKIDALFDATTRVIEEAEMAQHDFSAAMFQNLNTMEEYQKAKGSGS